MQINTLELAKNLVFTISIILPAVLDARAKPYASDLSLKNVKFFHSDNRVLALFENSKAKKVEFYFKNSNYEVRIFRNTNEHMTFFTKNFGVRSIILGRIQNFKNKTDSIAIFSFANGSRFSGSIICESKNTMAHLDTIESDFSSLLKKIPVNTATEIFDKNCNNSDAKSGIFNSLVEAIDNSNSELKKCLINNEKIKSALSANDEFRRIMITYYSNALKFANDFFSVPNSIKISCEFEGKGATVRPGDPPNVGAHVIRFNQSEFDDLTDVKDQLSLGLKFSSMIFHELEHIYFRIPDVVDTSNCEHQFVKSIAKHCSELVTVTEKAIPSCRIRSESIITAPSVGEKDTSRMAAENVNDISTPRTPSATPAEATGQEPVTTQLTAAQAQEVTRAAKSVFGAADSGNYEVEAFARRAFESGDVGEQEKLAQQIGDKFDGWFDRFSQNTTKLGGAFETTAAIALGATAIAATLPGPGSKGQPGDQLTPDQALQGYLTGNTDIAASAQPVLATNGVAPFLGSAGPVDVPGSAVERSAPKGVVGKIANTSGASAVAGTGSGGLSNGTQKIVPAAAAGAVVTGSGSLQMSESPAGAPSPYQIKSSSSRAAQDTPELLMLSAVKTISGSSYQRIKGKYENEKFLVDLATRGIAIQIVDGRGKVISTKGFTNQPTSGSRRPSSIDSQNKNRKQSSPSIIFIDNGKSLQRADD